jgi:hypothetical protein
MNRTTDRQAEERITIDSARTTAPRINRPWLARVGIVVGILAILSIILIVVRIGAGGESDPTSNPAELEPAPMPAQPPPPPPAPQP